MNFLFVFFVFFELITDNVYIVFFISFFCMQTINPCLWFSGNAEEAVDFYVSVFKDSRVLHKTNYFVENPSNMPVGSVMTVDFELFGLGFVALNGGPFFDFNPSLSFVVHCESVEEVDSLWEKLKSKVLMPLGNYSFSDRFGWLVDKFGVSWQLMFSEHVVPKQKIFPSFLFSGDKDGLAEVAINFYISVFKNSSKISSLIRYDESQAPNVAGNVLFSQFKLGNKWFSAVDSALEHDFDFNESVSFIVYCEDQEEIDYFYEKLSAVEESEVCGWLKDKFGVSWQLVTRDMDELLYGKNAKSVMSELLKMKRIDVNKLREISKN
jgi:predicted 3-demethylubiquinone-9 3-methyltransferase (glyoxalase superfamily)